jgi:iron complex outermembrane receptor protein
MPGTRFSRTKRPNLRAPLTAIGCFCLAALAGSFHAVAQTGAAGTSASAMTLRATATLQGAVSDPKGEMVPKAAVTVRNTATGSTKSTTTDAEGRFSIAGLPAGTYTVSVEAHGFATAVKQAVALGADGAEIEVTLQMGQATQAVTVEADATHSIAAALAPMDALLSETSARTEITATMIHNFMSPVADYGEAVEMAPGTFTTNSNGVGLGQSSTYFRGFPDGFYDIDFDGIPFYDTNTPTHHSWAFFPAQFLGGIDFDRSPGTASTIGPTPFGGSIHLLSKDFSPVQNVRATFSGGSFNTYLYDLEYDSSSFGPAHRFNMNVDIHHLQSQGYQTENNQTRNAGDIQMQYKFSEKTVLTGFSGVIWLDANTPNFNATRCQMYGAGAGYSCILSGTTLYPKTGAGINFLNTNNSDPLLYLDAKYNFYHVPTDFEYVGLHTQLGKGFVLDFKPYTYNYDNSEKYANATTITNETTIDGAKTYLGLPIAPCNVEKVKSGIGAYPCAVDKYNSYRKYGETSRLSQVSKFGILRAGMWYEWAKTNRHQYPSDPLDNYAPSAFPNFAEKFNTDSYQPFAEYELHIGPKLTFTPGVKFAYYTIETQQFADNGKKIGPLDGNPADFITNGGSYFATLPSASLNYRLKSNWSAYVQAAQGSIVPPSGVFDFNQGATGVAVKTLPKQQKNTTYQAGTVIKLSRVTLDADYYHVHFDNSYSSVPDASGEPVYFVQPSSVTQGVEGESNIYVTHGLSVYLNASYDKATYRGTLAATCVAGATGCTAATPQINVTAPSGLNVQQTPSDVETEGVTYQNKSWDLGLFNKRVGTEFQDNGAYHNQYTVNPFTLTNANLNYTVRSGRLANTKFAMSFNNLLNEHSITSVQLAGSPVAHTLSSNGIAYTDPFRTDGQTLINGQDNVSILPARSIMVSVTFGFSPKGMVSKMF